MSFVKPGIGLSLLEVPAYKPQKPHGLEMRIDTSILNLLTAKDLQDGSNLMEFLSKLDESQIKTIVDFLKLKESLEKNSAPAKDAEVKEAPKE